MEFGTEEALVIATIGLVLITGVLALFTLWLWQEAKATRRPRVAAFIDFVTHDYGEIRFINAGGGVALDLDITYGGEGGHQRQLAEPVMVPGDGWSYKLLSTIDLGTSLDEGLDAVLKVFSVMVVSGTYKDVRGKTYQINQRLDIAALYNDAKDGMRLTSHRGPTLPFYQLLTQIRDHLKKIADK